MATFQSFWHGKGLPTYQQLALKSFIDHGHDFVLYTYDELDVPAGVDLRDAKAILPRDRIFLYKAGEGRGNIAGFSDLFRFHLLHANGGWWVDTDVVCLSREITDPDFYLGWQDHRLVGTAIMRLAKGTALTRELCARADQAGTGIRYGQIGPALMTQMAKEHGIVDRLLPQPEIYPIAPLEALHVLMPSRTEEVRGKLAEAPFLHLWNEIHGRAAILGWVAPPLGSYIRELFLRHGFPVSQRFCYSAAELERINDTFIRSVEARTLFRRTRVLEAEAEELRKKLAEAETELAALRAQVSGRG